MILTILLCTCTASRTGSFGISKNPVLTSNTNVFSAVNPLVNKNDSPGLVPSPLQSTETKTPQEPANKVVVSKEDVLKAFASVDNINNKINNIGEIVPKMYERLKQQRLENDSLSQRLAIMEKSYKSLEHSNQRILNITMAERERNADEIRQARAFRNMITICAQFIFFTFLGICGIYLMVWMAKIVKEREVRNLLKNA